MDPILHLSIVVGDLEAARAFYVDLLGCTPGRRAPDWMDVWFFGLQLTLQAQPEAVLNAAQGGKRHFGVTLDRETFDALTRRIDEAGVLWLDPVTTLGLLKNRPKVNCLIPAQMFWKSRRIQILPRRYFRSLQMFHVEHLKPKPHEHSTSVQLLAK